MSEMFKMESWDQLNEGIKKPLITSVAVTGFITVLCTIFYFFTQPVIPLFYSLARNDQALTTKEWIFLFPIISLVITLLHSLLLSFFKDLDALVLRLFAWMTVVMQFFLILALVRIIVITL
ncbi:hypothetical protein KA082_01895 [Candidatus Woesebacteria bacterium]|nr:hypothetical protein [Candidatus Woesebacteria bacterium]